MKRIAVVGGGSTGHTVTADLILKGFAVNLCDTEAYSDILKQTQAIGEIEITGSAANGKARLGMVTTDIGRALDGVDLVVCCTVANRDREVAQRIAPHLRPGQAVLLSAGNGGSVIYRQVFDQMGLEGVVVGETSGNLFPCRLVGPGKVLVGLPYLVKKVAAFPARDTVSLIDAFAGVYEFAASPGILEAVFNAPNLIGHIAVTLLNVGAIENSKEPYYVFRQGLCSGVNHLVDAMWEEKKALMQVLGYQTAPPNSLMFAKLMDESIHEYDNFKALAGPDRIDNRYIAEDTPTMNCLFISVAQAMGVEVPLFRALVRVASAVNRVEYYAQGRTLENLGLGHLKGRELLEYFS